MADGQRRAEAALWDQSLLASLADSCHPSVPSPTDNKRRFCCARASKRLKCAKSKWGEWITHCWCLQQDSRLDPKGADLTFSSTRPLLTNWDPVLHLWKHIFVTICAVATWIKRWDVFCSMHTILIFKEPKHVCKTIIIGMKTIKLRGTDCKELVTLSWIFFSLACCFSLQPRWLLKH